MFLQNVKMHLPKGIETQEWTLRKHFGYLETGLGIVTYKMSYGAVMNRNLPQHV